MRCGHPHPGAEDRTEGGFTLIELLVVIVVMPLVVGAIAVALLSVFKLQGGVANRISASGDAQVVSANFVRDVQSASSVTTQTTPQNPTSCGSGTQVLGLQWGAGPTEVSYVEVAEGTSNSLFRNVCQGGNTTTPASTSVVSHDVPTNLNQQVTVTCASTVGCAAGTSWIATAGVSGVKLVVAQPASSYNYSLTAVPRAWTSASGGAPAGGQPVLPFELLGGGTCPSTVLTMSGGATLTVNSGSAAGTGTLGLTSPCASSIQVTNGATLAAASIVTANPSLSSMSGGGGPTETFQSGGPSNPFATLAPPQNPSTALSGSCPATSPVVGTCTSGEYSSGPTLGSNANVTFGTGSGTFIFDRPLDITNNAQISFGSGTYWFKGGIIIEGGSTVVFDTGTYTFGTTSTGTGNAITVSNGAIVGSGPGGALFYVEGGAVNFEGGTTTSLAGTSQYGGVAIWDVAATGTTNPLTLSNGSSVGTSYGGIYVPFGQVTLTGAGTMTTTFVVAGTASLTNGTSLVTGS